MIELIQKLILGDLLSPKDTSYIGYAPNTSREGSGVLNSFTHSRDVSTISKVLIIDRHAVTRSKIIGYFIKKPFLFWCNTTNF